MVSLTYYWFESPAHDLTLKLFFLFCCHDARCRFGSLKLWGFYLQFGLVVCPLLVEYSLQAFRTEYKISREEEVVEVWGALRWRGRGASEACFSDSRPAQATTRATLPFFLKKCLVLGCAD